MRYRRVKIWTKNIVGIGLSAFFFYHVQHPIFLVFLFLLDDPR